MKHLRAFAVSVLLSSFIVSTVYSADEVSREDKHKQDLQDLQKKFDWWPTDAKPAPVKDPVRGGYWWWPNTPGEKRPWGNRGFVYVYKIIFDYKEEELPAPKQKELRACLLVRKIIKNVKVYFDYDKASLREDAMPVLEEGLRTLNKNPNASILITGNCDVRGTEKYNEKLGRHRAQAVKDWMTESGVSENRIKIVSRGKLDAIGHVRDLVGMQKDRNAQFMVAEVEEVMMPYMGGAEETAAAEGTQPAAPAVETSAAPSPEIAKELEGAEKVGEDKFVIEKKEVVEGDIKVSTKEYVIQEGDTLWKIAERELKNGNRWTYLYEFNKDRIKNPNKLKKGGTILIPLE